MESGCFNTDNMNTHKYIKSIYINSIMPALARILFKACAFIFGKTPLPLNFKMILHL